MRRKSAKTHRGEGRFRISPLSPVPSPHSNGQKGSSPFWISPRYHRRRQDCSFRDPGLRFTDRLPIPVRNSTKVFFFIVQRQFERYHTSHFSLLNCSVRGRHGAHCAPLRTHPVGAATGRQPAAETFRICHCEPVTDVTGVAIRFPFAFRLSPALRFMAGRHASGGSLSCSGKKGRKEPAREEPSGGRRDFFVICEAVLRK